MIGLITITVLLLIICPTLPLIGLQLRLRHPFQKGLKQPLELVPLILIDCIDNPSNGITILISFSFVVGGGVGDQ